MGEPIFTGEKCGATHWARWGCAEAITGYKQVVFLGLQASGISGATSKWYFWGYKQVAFLGLLLCGFHGKRSAALEGHISITAVPLAHSPSPAAKAPSNHVLECHIC